MTKEEFVNKYVSEHYHDIHVSLSNLVGSGNVKQLYEAIHTKLVELAGSDFKDKYNTIIHQQLIDLIHGLDKPQYSYVDMGEAGIWATCNVGATSPEEPGLYFQWGDTQGYTAEQVRNGEKSFLLTDYKFSSDSASWEYPELTKYCNNTQYGKDGLTDTLTVLQPEDDAAHVHMGGDWRMPTSDEFIKLFDLCDYSWDNYGETEVNGVLLTLKTDSSKQLFFPAAGYLNEEVSYDGYRTCVWTSSLYTDEPDPLKSLGLLGSNMDGFAFYGTDRYWGLSVRGILGVGE